MVKVNPTERVLDRSSCPAADRSRRADRHHRNPSYRIVRKAMLSVEVALRISVRSRHSSARFWRRNIAYSSQMSGQYLSTELFPRLGIAGRIRNKARRIEGDRVGAVVARGEAEIGSQQISELLPIPGIYYVGPLPPEVQRITLFSPASRQLRKTPPPLKTLSGSSP